MQKRLTELFVGMVVAVALVVSVSLVVAPAPAANAATASDFDPGNIISDIVFFNSRTMTVADIQSFLNAKGKPCLAGYTCLKDYKQTTTSKAADPMCAAYAGAANESSAMIIYKVATACGINPQSLLVTLEKEQGLVTRNAPSAAIYQKAMGFGCPDTASCDSQYYGFFNQMYKGAWAFQRYTMPAGTGAGTAWYSNYSAYSAGKTATVKWNPNSACGSSQVYIQNRATGSLYTYTPYRPNAAALNNLYGVGDSCSSYGNRNFWRMFTDWFGLTKGLAPVAQLKALHDQTGGYNGSLGYGTKLAASYAGSGVGQDFMRGRAYWSTATGAFATYASLGQSYAALLGPAGVFGYPIAAEKSEVGGGKSQAFQQGLLYNTEGTKVHRLMNVMNQGYRALGGPAGSLGIPIDSERAAPASGLSQRFTKGTLYWSALMGTKSIPADIESLYASVGGPGGSLGYPIAERVIDSSGLNRSEFQNGAIYWSATEAPRMVLRVTPVVDRLSGPDRYETSVAASKSGFPQTAPIVYVASGQDYADALSAAPAAVKQGASLLLSRQKDLPVVVKTEIQRLKPGKIVVVGGAGAVSDAVLQALKVLQPNTVRVEGRDRYETSRKIIAQAFPTAPTAYVASGLDYPDALSAAAAAGAGKFPVVLVKGTDGALDAPTQTMLKSLAVTKSVIAGGTAVVSSGIETSLKTFTSVTRHAGVDRYDTSQRLSRAAFPAGAARVFLAGGTNFPDALSGAVLAGAQASPLYVVRPTCIPAETLLDLSILGAARVTLLGGEGSLAAGVARLQRC